MQLLSLSISNVGSFPSTAGAEQSSCIRFHSGEKGATNVLIGPNGAGKSTILETIHQVFLVGLVEDYAYDKKKVEREEKTEKPISIVPHTLTQVEKNIHFPQEKSHIALDIIFTQEDYENIVFLRSHAKDIELLVRTYSPVSDFFFPNVPETALRMQNTLHVSASFDYENKQVLLTPPKNAVEKLLLLYLRHHELFQICIHIFNTYKKKADECQRPALHNTFALLGALRITDNKSASIGQLLVQKKLRTVARAHGVGAIQKDPFYQQINTVIRTYTGMSLAVCYENDKVLLSCQTKEGIILPFSRLSSGEQAFLSLILTVFGYNIRNGLLIIDEPELYLHPQTQQRFVDLLAFVEELFALQCIVATHSPILVTPQTLPHVMRCNKTNGNSFVTNAPAALSQTEASIMHMLKYGNTAKVFFATKIIMVEGETDQYFFAHYLKYLSSLPHWQDKVHSYEIIDIGGKGSFDPRSGLLTKFGIQAFYIGDWDNILATAADANLYTYKKKLQTDPNVPARYRIRRKTEGYAKLIAFLKNERPLIRARLRKKTMALRTKHVFILPEGDLETYIGLQKKGLESTVSFCRTEFKKRYTNPNFATYRNDLEKIFAEIFS